jgi:2-isopropylmalate synthase
MKKEKICIFDTTLRDGAQTPYCQMTSKTKIEIAKALEKLGVDVIEAGFPISSEDNFITTSAIAQVVKNPIVCALARPKKEDIDLAYEAIK